MNARPLQKDHEIGVVEPPDGKQKKDVATVVPSVTV